MLLQLLVPTNVPVKLPVNDAVILFGITVGAYDELREYDELVTVPIITDAVIYDAVKELLDQLDVPVKLPTKDPVNEAVTPVTFTCDGRIVGA